MIKSHPDRPVLTVGKDTGGAGRHVEVGMLRGCFVVRPASLSSKRDGRQHAKLHGVQICTVHVELTSVGTVVPSKSDTAAKANKSVSLARGSRGCSGTTRAVACRIACLARICSWRVRSHLPSTFPVDPVPCEPTHCLPCAMCNYVRAGQQRGNWGRVSTRMHFCCNADCARCSLGLSSHGMACWAPEGIEHGRIFGAPFDSCSPPPTLSLEARWAAPSPPARRSPKSR